MTSYDLTAAEARTNSQSKSINRFLDATQWGLLAMWIVVMVLVTPKVGESLPHLSSGQSTGWLVLTLFGAVVIFGLVVLWFLAFRLAYRIPHGGRGPIRVDVSEEGFTLLWELGPPRAIRWNSRPASLLIKDFTEQGYGARMRITRTLWVALTNDAVSALTRSAMAAGMGVSSVVIVGSSGTPGRQILISARSVHGR